MSRLSRLNSPTAIWWQFSVRAQEQSACDTVGIHTYMDGCVLPTTSIIHQLDDKWPAGDDSCSSRKEVSVAEEEANLEKDTHACTHTHKQTHDFPVLSGELASLVWSMYTLQQSTTF